MKKIRLLALLLALLMIPFGMLFACKDDEGSDKNNEEEESDDKDGSSSVGQTTVAADFTVEDGVGAGYIVRFNFNKAPDGQLGIINPYDDSTYVEYSDYKLTQPYAKYFLGLLARGENYNYIVKNPTPSNVYDPDKYLEIQRTSGLATSVYMDFKTKENLLSTRDKYTIEFELDYSKGLFGSDGVIAGFKGNTSQTFLTITNNAIYDCNKVAIYGEKDSDYRGWIKIALTINDLEREYDVYIDSGDGNGYVRQTFGVDFNSDEEKYPAYTEESFTDMYRFSISTAKSNNTYFRIDDLGFKSGIEIESSKSDAASIYTDKVDSKYAMVVPSIAGLTSFLNTQPHVVNGLKQDLFGDGVLLSDRITITKINYTNDTYSELAAFYNEAIFIRTLSAEEKKNPDAPENKINKFVLDTKAKKAYFYKNLTTSDAIVANYTVSGSGKNAVLKFTWLNYGGTMPLSAKFSGNVLTTYSDERGSAANKVATYDFDFALNESTIDIVRDYGVLLGKYSEISNLVGTDGTYTVVYNGKNVTFTPAGGESYTGTYTVNGGVITFDFGANGVKYGKYDDVTRVLTVYSDAECITEVGVYELEAPDAITLDKIGANERYGIKFVNFSEIQTTNKTTQFTSWDGKWYSMSSNNLSALKFGIYVSSEMYKNGDIFTIVLKYDANNYAEYVLKPQEAGKAAEIKDNTILYANGLNEVEIDIKKVAALASKAVSLEFKYEYKYTENKEEKTAVKSDLPFYITAFEWILEDVVVEVAGPADDKLDCDHVDYIGDSLLIKVKTPIEGNCHYATYYIMRCSECLAEFVDNSADKIGYINAKHNFVTANGTFTVNSGVYVFDFGNDNINYGKYDSAKKTLEIYSDADFQKLVDVAVYDSHSAMFIGEKADYILNETDGTIAVEAKTIIEPTCTEDGYTFKTCVGCGQNYVYNVSVASDHDNVAISIVGKTVTQACKNCGIVTQVLICTEMMSYEDKILTLGISSSDRKSWNIAEDSTLNLTNGGGIASFVSAVSKTGSTAKIKAEDTEYGKMLLIEGGSGAAETYIDVVPGPINTNTFFKGQNFVFEFDYMKGKPGTNGQYVNMSAGLGWRNGPITYNNWGMLNFTPSGGLRLSEYGTAGRGSYGNTKEYVTEQGVLYNVAVHHNLATNTMSLYVNGVKWDECQFLASVEDSMTFGVTHIRFWCGGVPNGSQMYIDNYMHYAADKEPICVLSTLQLGGLDFEGEIELKDEKDNTMLKDFSVTEGGVDVEMSIPGYISNKLSKQQYTLEFTIDGEILRAGTILSGKKIGVGEEVEGENGEKEIHLNGGYYRYADILTTDGIGNLYAFGILVYKGEEGATGFENLRISLAFDDNEGVVYVYINGQAVTDGISYDGEFALGNGVIRGFVLENECGAYFVNGLKMYTGNDVR